MKTSLYVQLEKELQSLKPLMEKAVDSILDQEVSTYPILVVHKHEMAVGVELVVNDPKNWSINASSLEEFVSKQIIQLNKIDSFRTIYKNPKKYICLFVLSELGANFIFLPRHKPSKENQL